MVSTWQSLPHISKIDKSWKFHTIVSNWTWNAQQRISGKLLVFVWLPERLLKLYLKEFWITIAAILSEKHYIFFKIVRQRAERWWVRGKKDSIKAPPEQIVAWESQKVEVGSRNRVCNFVNTKEWNDLIEFFKMLKSEISAIGVDNNTLLSMATFWSIRAIRSSNKWYSWWFLKC